MKFQLPWDRDRPGGLTSRLRHACLAALLLCGVVLCFSASPLQAAEPTGEHVLQGRLLYIQGTGPVVKTAKKQVPLAGRYAYIFRTLGDKRLRDDEVRLEGEFVADGNFRVDNIFTIHHGEVYRVRYFCETCNIVGLGPGKCVCCQQPTELQEVPVNKNDKKILITH